MTSRPDVERTTGRLRELSRYCFVLPVTFSWKDAGERRSGAGKTRDLSARGIFVETAACPPLSAIVRCELLVPNLDEDRINHWLRGTAVGRVVRSDANVGFAISSRVFVLRDED